MRDKDGQRKRLKEKKRQEKGQGTNSATSDRMKRTFFSFLFFLFNHGKALFGHGLLCCCCLYIFLSFLYVLVSACCFLLLLLMPNAAASERSFSCPQIRLGPTCVYVHWWWWWLLPRSPSRPLHRRLSLSVASSLGGSAVFVFVIRFESIQS